MNYDFDQVIERRSSDSIKWNAYPEDVLPMWVADTDFRSPEPVIRRLRERVEHGIFGYPTSLGGRAGEVSPLVQAIQERLLKLYNWQVAAEAIVLVPGVVTAFNLACHALAGRGAGVLVQTPVYPPIISIGKETGVLQQEMLLERAPDGHYTVDLQRFEAAITPETRAFLLCNPHNPVGRVFTPDELRGMAEICLKHNLAIISDEIHCDLVYPGHPHTPIASLDPEIARRTLTLMAPSKTYNLAGLECSFAIIPDAEMRRRYMGARQGILGWVNLAGTTAAEAAYQEGQEWLDQMLVYLQANRDALVDFVDRRLPGVQMCAPQGTYLAWLDCRAANLPGSPYKFFLENAKVALNDGATFGSGGEGFVRLNFGCPRSVLMEGLERIERALAAQ
ncbi:MAG: MalY/PatB family protein [Chloroflexota bacterium]